MSVYQSDATQFINQLKKNNPTLEKLQREGREIFWRDCPIDLDERARQQNARVPQKAYPYQSQP